MSSKLRTHIKRKKDRINKESTLQKVVNYTRALTDIGRGNYISGAKTLYDIHSSPVSNPIGVISANMRRRNRNNGRKGKGRKRGRRVPAALKPMRIPVKRVVMYQETSGSSHRWYYQIPLSLLIASFRNTFDEFKVVSMTVRYVPNNSLSETGLYTAIMLDREGFGPYGSATAVQWFEYLGCMPGSVIKPRHTPSVHRWKPTEPSAKDWIRGKNASSLLLATIYICNNGKETEELGGLLDIRASLLVRGRYWNASVNTDGEPHTPPPYILERSSTVQVAPIIESAKPSLSRSTSHGSLIGGFLAL